MTDYLIIGQGLAGSLLAFFLRKRGKSVRVVDHPSPSASSRVAAGIYNPVTGRRFVKTWMADEIFPAAVSTYRELEVVTGSKFLYPRKIIRKISSVAEWQEWKRKAARPEYLPYVKPNSEIRDLPVEVEIMGGGNLDVGRFITAMAQHFKENHMLLEADMDYADIRINNSDVEWKDIRAGRIIFCEGYRGMQNPWFDDLPFTHAKGEILTIHAPGLKQDHILSKGVFVLPVADQQYKVGATYDWDDLSDTPTDAGKKELLDKLRKVVDHPFEVIAHQAGIRPTVKDRRPLIGMHPEHPRLGIFNGLGTKGVSLGPWFAHHFVEHLEDGRPLLREVNITRFSKGR